MYSKSSALPEALFKFWFIAPSPFDDPRASITCQFQRGPTMCTQASPLFLHLAHSSIPSLELYSLSASLSYLYYLFSINGQCKGLDRSPRLQA
jgi:hypothetical protein